MSNEQRLYRYFIIFFFFLFVLLHFFIFSPLPLQLWPRLREFKRQEYTIIFHLFEEKKKKEEKRAKRSRDTALHTVEL